MPANRYPRYYKSFADSGAVGNANGDPTSAVTGFTDDTAAIQAFIDAQPSTGCDLFLDRWYYVPGGLTRWKSNMRILGSSSGGFRGNPAYLPATVPIPSTLILIQGALIGTPLAYPSTFAANTQTFTGANSWTLGDMLLLSNFPSDPGGTDAYTQPGGTSAPRLYNYAGAGAIGGTNQVVHPNNLRQTRRREPCIISDAVNSGGSAGFTLYSPTVYGYNSLTQLQFQKIAPIKNVMLEGLNLLDIYLDADLTDGFRAPNANLIRSTIAITRSLSGMVLNVKLDAMLTDNCINIAGASRFCDISGNGRGGRIYSDNGLVRVDQASDFTAVFNLAGHSHGLYGCIVDTNYFEAPDGYTDIPSLNGKVHLIDSSGNSGLVATCDCFAADISNMDFRVLYANSSSAQAFIRGVRRSTLHMNAELGKLHLEASTGIRLTGYRPTIEIATWADPRNPGTTRGNSLIEESTYTTLY